jgi:hypothetical protein
MKRIWRWICEEVELLLLAFLIILNILDLFEVLPPFLDYLDKIAGVIIIAYLIYRASPSKIILGKRHGKLDFGLIFSFVLLLSHKIIAFTAVAYELLLERIDQLIYFSKVTGDAAVSFTYEVGNTAALNSADFGSNFYGTVVEQLSWNHDTVYFIVQDWNASEVLAATMPPFSLFGIVDYLNGSFFYFAKFVLENQVILGKLSVYVGGIMLLLFSLYAAWNFKITKSSLLHVIHGDARWLHAKPLRAVVIFFAFVFFFLFIFSLMIEWLGIVADAPIVFVGILFALFAMLWYHKGRSGTSFITKVGKTGEKFYDNFIGLFHTPYGVALGLGGILLLHMLTDFGMFIIPYTMYQHEMIYFDQGAAFFSAGHETLFSITELFVVEKSSLFFQDLSMVTGFFAEASVVWIYLFNVVALVFLFFAPAYMWWVLFKRKKAHENKWILVCSYIALGVFVAFPLITVGTLDVPGLVGADITTNKISDNGGFINPSHMIALGCVIGLTVLFLSHFRFFRRELVYGSFAAALVFFGMYSGYYYYDMVWYYVDVLLSGVLDPFLWFYFVVFGLVTVFFYPIAYFVFLYEAIKHYRLRKDD